jgi:hypothetical protein
MSDSLRMNLVETRLSVGGLFSSISSFDTLCRRSITCRRVPQSYRALREYRGCISCVRMSPQIVLTTDRLADIITSVIGRFQDIPRGGSVYISLICNTSRPKENTDSIWDYIRLRKPVTHSKDRLHTTTSFRHSSLEHGEVDLSHNFGLPFSKLGIRIIFPVPLLGNPIHFLSVCFVTLR